MIGLNLQITKKKKKKSIELNLTTSNKVKAI
jgi:hypothetical protein